MHSSGINGEGELRGQPAKPGSPEKMADKTDCVSVDALPVTQPTTSKHERQRPIQW